MNIVTIESISKSYGVKTLFENISFTINDHDKTGLIGVNGTGKSTLLKIIAGYETPDTGLIKIPSGMSIEYLSQNPVFDPDSTVLEQVFRGESPATHSVREYEVKTILTKLGINNFDEKIDTLSGGQKKRVALSRALISPCDLLILDEPTNHMDNNTIAWLETYLGKRKGALLMITHDRYFLDRVVNKTIELDGGKLYTYTGNYSAFIEKKLERQNLETAIERKRQNLYKKELNWIRTGAKARTTKQKARIQRFEELKDAKPNIDDSEIDISVAHSRLGKKIITFDNVSKSFGDKILIQNFSYVVLKNDRIGIIGDNGLGKSTLLNLIAGKLNMDCGTIDIGTTVNIAYFSQESEEMNINLRGIEYIKESAEYVTTADGTRISASQMMERFLFSKELQWTHISRLSGGERRRLYLLKVLMDAPNVLILDEPTNDFDIDTLKVLENYIDEFNGAVISVSHDRYFLDRTCNKIFSFEGCGKIAQYTGNYTDHIIHKKDVLNDNLKEGKSKGKSNSSQREKKKKIKFTYKEKIEYEKIDAEIEILENKLTKLEDEIQKYATDFTKLQELMANKDIVEEELFYKMERQEYLSGIEEQMKSANN